MIGRWWTRALRRQSCTRRARWRSKRASCCAPGRRPRSLSRATISLYHLFIAPCTHVSILLMLVLLLCKHSININLIISIFIIIIIIIIFIVIITRTLTFSSRSLCLCLLRNLITYLLILFYGTYYKIINIIFYSFFDYCSIYLSK